MARLMVHPLKIREKLPLSIRILQGSGKGFSLNQQFKIYRFIYDYLCSISLRAAYKSAFDAAIVANLRFIFGFGRGTRILL
jgi:hypothetical protein